VAPNETHARTFDTHVARVGARRKQPRLLMNAQRTGKSPDHKPHAAPRRASGAHPHAGHLIVNNRGHRNDDNRARCPPSLDLDQASNSRSIIALHKTTRMPYRNAWRCAGSRHSNATTAVVSGRVGNGKMTKLVGHCSLQASSGEVARTAFHSNTATWQPK
jgi:hypothetical protein